MDGIKMQKHSWILFHTEKDIILHVRLMGSEPRKTDPDTRRHRNTRTNRDSETEREGGSLLKREMYKLKVGVVTRDGEKQAGIKGQYIRSNLPLSPPLNDKLPSVFSPLSSTTSVLRTRILPATNSRGCITEYQEWIIPLRWSPVCTRNGPMQD